MLPNFSSQQRLTPPLSGTSNSGSNNSFMQSLLFQQHQQQPPPSSSPSRMFRQGLPTTSIGNSSVNSGSTGNLNSAMNATAAMLNASLQQQQQQQQQQQRFAFGQALFGSNTPSSSTPPSLSSTISSNSNLLRRPATSTGSAMLMDPSEFPVLASSGGTGTSTAQSTSTSRLLNSVSSSVNSSSNLGFNAAQSAQAAAAMLANRFASAGVPNAAALSNFLANFQNNGQQQSQQWPNLSPQLAMAMAAAMSSGQGNGSDSNSLSQPPQPAFRMDEDDFPALKPVVTSASSAGAAGLIGSGNPNRSLSSLDSLAVGGNDQNQTSLGNSGLSAFSTVEQNLGRMNALGSGRSSTHLQQAVSMGATSPTNSGSGITVDNDGSVSNIPMGLVADAYGLVGLLSFMKTAPSSSLDPASSAIAVGLALTELGLRLNAPEPLHTSFASPWHDAAGSRPYDMDCPVPPEYLVSQQQQQIAAMRDPVQGTTLSSFGNRALQQQQQFQMLPIQALRQSNEDLLFYLFYTCTSDYIQLLAAHELVRRHWRFHRRHEIWIQRADGHQAQDGETGVFEVFDHRSWKRERRELRVDYKDVDPTELFQFIQQQQAQMNPTSNVSSSSASSSGVPFSSQGSMPTAVSVGGSSSLLTRNAF